jgi:hypothetical protein
MRRLLALTIALASVALAALPGRAAHVVVHLHDGARLPDSTGITVWANSPETRISVHNPGTSVVRTRLHWRNTLQDAYLVTPQGVAEAPGQAGDGLTSDALLGAGSRGEWGLASNARRRYVFSVASGRLSPAPVATAEFAIHLGDSGLPVGALMTRLQDGPHPTYVLPGVTDSRARFEDAVGRTSRTFRMGPDRFVVIDSTDRRLAHRQLTWVRSLMARARQDRTRRVFAFIHHPPQSGRAHLSLRRADSVALLAALASGPPVTLFAARRPGLHAFARNGVQVVTVGPGQHVEARVDETGMELSAKGLTP